MVQITHRPIKEFIVYKQMKYDSPNSLARKAMIESSPVATPYLKWINGIIYRLGYPTSISLSETSVKEFLAGKIWVEVEFAEMVEFSPTINSEGENVAVPIVDASNDENEADLVDWIKNLK